MTIRAKMAALMIRAMGKGRSPPRVRRASKARGASDWGV